jgi:hypothetical protein
MIVISAGMQKAGSGLYFNLTNDLLIAAGMQDVREIKEKHGLEDLLKHYNCNISELVKNNLAPLLSIHESGNSFVVKTHNGPTKFLKKLIKKGVVKVTCIYRDPRDVTLSAMDHGKKIRDKGESHSFVHCTTTAETVPMVKSWLDTSIMEWLKLKDLLCVEYEDLIENPIEELEKLCKFLGIDYSHIDLQSLYAKYSRDNLDDSSKNFLHFNVGKTGRYLTAMSKEDLNLCNRHFSKYLKKLDYPV